MSAGVIQHGGCESAIKAKTRRAIAVLCGFGLFTSMDIALLTVLLEPIKRDLALTDIQLGLVQGTAFGIGMGLSALPNGLAIDRFNRVRMITGAMIFWIVMMAAVALRPSFSLLFVCELTLGALNALITSAAVSLLSDVTRPDRRSFATSVFAVAQITGQSAAFLVGGLMIDMLPQLSAAHGWAIPASWSWRVVYMLFAGAGLLLMPAALRLQEPKRMEVRQASQGLAASVRELISYSGILVPLFVAAGLSIMANSAIMAWIAPLLTRSYGQTAAQVGSWLGVISFVFGIAGCLLSGRLSELARAKRKAITLASAVAAAVAMPCAFIGMVPSVGWAMALLGVVVISSVTIGVNVSIALVLLMPNELRGLTQGLYLLISFGVGRSLSPGIVALLADGFAHGPTLGRAIALVAAPGYLLAAIIFSRIKIQPFDRGVDA